ncbi:isovaleryl-CoA dehydrogenase [Arenimonas sp.]|uniref:isovaleryl-CoA dehydrogenase n=1 Tax=Arenimonas sp. TaxID=1872635 RepID=UPI0035ADE6C4
MDIRERFRTHEVENQPPPLAPSDLWQGDVALREAVAREGGSWAGDALAAYGALAGGELQELGRLANENRPRFLPFDARGQRIDQVEFHPAYHQLMRTAVEHGVPGFAWRHAGREGAHVARAALMFLHNQADQGSSCPLTMTYASVPALMHAPALAAEWLPRIRSDRYDPSHRPGWEKPGVTIGMGMTEKQGGSDVRANTTRATPVPGSEGLYSLVGHKWFYSAPMCDAFLVLAQAPGGLGCFLLPRFAPDGSRNAVQIQRLKDKLGDWSNASAEIEFQGALAWRIGDEGRGVATILQMVSLTRLDCLLGSASLMRQGLARAMHFARHRRTFGKRLVEHGLMRSVLADLALESEAATALAFRVARAVDASERDPCEAALARLTTALGKYWVCKRAPAFLAEAMECLGGIGYVEETGMPQLYRQAPLNSIWEGSGNIQCLDVLRALGREPECARAYFGELAAARGASAALDAEAAAIESLLRLPADELVPRARELAGRMAIALQASVLLRGAPEAVAQAFCHARLGAGSDLGFGGLARREGLPELLARVLP